MDPTDSQVIFGPSSTTVSSSSGAERGLGSTSVVTPWTFRDGREYVVSLSTPSSARNLAIHISDKVTAEEWCCQYDFKYIEELTQRTGNYKPFDIFVSMIKCVLLKNTEAVSIDLMTLEDLKCLKLARSKSSGNPLSIVDLAGKLLKNGAGGTSGHEFSTKKFLIVTYTAEFDVVYYPLPLNYTGPPDTKVMQNTIRKLKADVSQLRAANTSLMKKIKSKGQPARSSEKKRSRSRERTFSWEHDESFQKSKGHEGHGQGNFEDNNDSSYNFNQKLLKGLQEAVQKLEERLDFERSEHFEKLEALQKENKYLRNKVDSLRETEEELMSQLKEFKNNNGPSQNYYNESLDNIPRFKGRRSSTQRIRESSTGGLRGRSSSGNQRLSPSTRNTAENRNSRSRIRVPTTTNSRVRNSHGQRTLSHSSSLASVPPKRTSSPGGGSKNRKWNSHQILHRKSSEVNLRSMSSSPARNSKSKAQEFDPTAYVKDKQLRQTRIAQIRLARIESKVGLRQGHSRSHSLAEPGRGGGGGGSGGGRVRIPRNSNYIDPAETKEYHDIRYWTNALRTRSRPNSPNVSVHSRPTTPIESRTHRIGHSSSGGQHQHDHDLGSSLNNSQASSPRSIPKINGYHVRRGERDNESQGLKSTKPRFNLYTGSVAAAPASSPQFLKKTFNYHLGIFGPKRGRGTYNPEVKNSSQQQQSNYKEQEQPVTRTSSTGSPPLTSNHQTEENWILNALGGGRTLSNF